MTPQRQTNGTLATVCSRIRQQLDEPTLVAKYTDEIIVDRLNEIWPEVVRDLYGAAQNPPLSRFDVTIAADQEYGILPATAGEIREILVLESASGDTIGEIKPRSRFNAYGRGIAFEGSHRFRMDPIQTAPTYLRFLYVPDGSGVLLSGSLPKDQFTTTTVVLDTTDLTTSLGSVDQRPNAYLGSLIHLTGYNGYAPTSYVRFPVQTRPITGYNVATGTLTVDPAWDFDPATLPTTVPESKIAFEVYPPEAQGLFGLLWRAVARDICIMEGRTDRAKSIGFRYAEVRRTTLLAWNHKQTRSPAAYNPLQDIDSPEGLAYL